MGEVFVTYAGPASGVEELVQALDRVGVVAERLHHVHAPGGADPDEPIVAYLRATGPHDAVKRGVAAFDEQHPATTVDVEDGNDLGR